jgi:hypothetical protein
MITVSSGTHHVDLPDGMVLRVDSELLEMSYFEALNDPSTQKGLKLLGFTCKMMETNGLTVKHNGVPILVVPQRAW